MRRSAVPVRLPGHHPDLWVPTRGGTAGHPVGCLGRAAAAKRAAAADIWAQGGEPAYHQTYAACMASFGWKRIVVSSYRYG